MPLQQVDTRLYEGNGADLLSFVYCRETDVKPVCAACGSSCISNLYPVCRMSPLPPPVQAVRQLEVEVQEQIHEVEVLQYLAPAYPSAPSGVPEQLPPVYLP